MSEDLQELHEHAEHAREHPALVGATFTMSVIAVLVAAVSVLGHRAHTRTIVEQTESADSWAEYQARNIRRHSYQLFIDLLSVTQVKDPNQAEQMKAKYAGEIKRYEEELKGAQGRAVNFSSEAEQSERRGARYDLGEVCLEAGLVITSITLITRRRFFWGMGSGLALAGILIAVTGVLMH
jgi:Domain of unknown function (DUF4337)